jgi:hypothetical protein
MREGTEVAALWVLAGMCALVSVAHLIAYLWRHGC